MEKKLLTNKNVMEFVLEHEKRIYIDSTMILTSGAKEVLRNRNIKIIFGHPEEKKTFQAEMKHQGFDLEGAKDHIRRIMMEDYCLKDEAKIVEIISKVLAKMNDE